MRVLRLAAAIAGFAALLTAAFALGGPRLALPLGFAAALAIVVFAVRQKPFEPILPPLPPDDAPHLLVVITVPLEDRHDSRALTDAIERMIAPDGELPAVAGDEDLPAEILLLAPARTKLLDRWAGDLEASRSEAQRNLVVTVATLARADLDAKARVGDADIVQAVEDQLRSYPATGVILLTSGYDERGDRAALDLEQRLTTPLERISV